MLGCGELWQVVAETKLAKWGVMGCGGLWWVVVGAIGVETS